MSRIANNSVLIQLGTLMNLSSGVKLTDIRPLSQGAPTQVHDTYNLEVQRDVVNGMPTASETAGTPQSITARQEPQPTTRQDEITELVRIGIRDDYEGAAERLAAMGEGVIPMVFDAALHVMAQDPVNEYEEGNLHEFLDVLSRSLVGEDWDRARDIYYSSEHMRRAAAPVVKGICGLLFHEQLEVRYVAASTLNYLANDNLVDPTIALKPLTDALNDSDADVKETVQDVLKKILRTQVKFLKFLGRSNHIATIEKAIWAVSEVQDANAVEPLERIMRDHVEDISLRRSAMKALVKIGNTDAISKLFDLAIYGLVGVENGDPIDVKTDMLTKEAIRVLVEMDDFHRDVLISRVGERGRAHIESALRSIAHDEVVDQIIDAARSIVEKLAAGMGIDVKVKISASDTTTIATVLAMSLNEESSSPEENDVYHVTVEISRGHDAEGAADIMRSLNFLIHHEFAHVPIIHQHLQHWAIDVSLYKRFDPQDAAHYGHEVMLDKLALEMARKIYVHGDGDVLFEERVREVISIHSYLGLARIVLCNYRKGSGKLSDADFARKIAVLREMAGSSEISSTVKKELEALAQKYYTVVTENRVNSFVSELDALIKAYRGIFRKTTLKI